ncbi:hypothetical protein ACFQ60_43575 [Streptomyces zhihengii]
MSRWRAKPYCNARPVTPATCAMSASDSGRPACSRMCSTARRTPAGPTRPGSREPGPGRVKLLGNTSRAVTATRRATVSATSGATGPSRTTSPA